MKSKSGTGVRTKKAGVDIMAEHNTDRLYNAGGIYSLSERPEFNGGPE